jgi:heat shock protein HtpX
VATRGLLDKLEPIELEAVIAHEMSHIGNYDIRIMTVATVLVGLVALISDVFLRYSWMGAGSRRNSRDKGGGGIGVAILLIAIVGAILAPIVAQAIKFGISRQREYLADASGALLSRHPEALARALEKISADPEPLEVANKATAHLYIANPLKEHASFLNNMFDTHPPIEERIRLLRNM